MYMKSLRLAPVVLCLGLMACSSDEESQPEEHPANQGTINSQVAQSTTQSVISALKLASAGNGQSAAFSLAGAASAAFAIVAPSGGAAPSGAAQGSAQQALTSGTCECNETSCTFTDCADDSSGLGWSINGTISWDGGHVVCDLSIVGNSSGFDWNFHEVGDIVITDTTIDGTLSTDGQYDLSAQGQNVHAEWDSHLDFDAIEFNAAGCPMSGSISVDATVTANGSSYEGSGNVSFDGSGC